MIHVQNSTLAGGVAVGAMADMMIQPWGAMLVGTLAGVISVLGYEYMTLWFAQHYGFHDTCGVNNLHGTLRSGWEKIGIREKQNSTVASSYL